MNKDRMQEEKRAGLQEEEQLGLQEEQAELQEEEHAGLQDEEQVGLQEEEQAGLQVEKQTGLQEEKQVGLQEEEPAEFAWSPGYDTQPTDFTLVIKSMAKLWKFYVHRDILLKSSDYFSAMFSSQMIESREGVVNLQLVTPEVFTILVEAMYTGEFPLTQENAFEVVKAAEMLQIQDPLKSEYIAYLRNTFINLRHCFQLMDFCISISLQELYCDARKFCLAHLSELKCSTTLTNLSLSKLYDYLSDEYLIVETEMQILETINIWLCANKNTDPYNSPDYNLRDKVKKMITECVSLKEKEDEEYDFVTDEVFSDKWLPAEYFESAFSERPRKEEVFMFMAKLTLKAYGQLTDILKLDVDTGNAIKVGTMASIVEQPGFSVSAACCSGPYVYLSAGGNEFGLQVWRFDVSKPYSVEEAVGDRFEFRCDHAMVFLEHKLYIFGGMGRDRLDNLQMHSLDLAAGHWIKLPSMPLHACNPPTATADNCIYYLNLRWILCYYSLKANNWAYLYAFSEPFPEMLHKFRPLTLFPFVSGKTKCFIVATLTNSSLKIKLLHIIVQASTVTDVADMAVDFAFAKSVAVNGKLVFFFTSNKRDDTVSVQNEEGTTLQTACRFDPQTNVLHCLPNIQNVTQALAVVALPFFPREFCMKTKEL